MGEKKKKEEVRMEKFYEKWMISMRWKAAPFPHWHQIFYFNPAEGMLIDRLMHKYQKLKVDDLMFNLHLADAFI